MDGSLCQARAQPPAQEGLLSAAPAVLAGEARQTGSVLRASTRPLRVLTLTPFYPAAEDESQGSFVAEPLRAMEDHGVCNFVIAVQPVYRAQKSGSARNVASAWRRYFSIPGNSGLAVAGDLLTLSLARRVRFLHTQQPFDLIHAHGALPCGRAAALLSKNLHVPFVVSVHGLDAYGERQGGPFWGKWCHRKSAGVYRAARAVICVSQKVTDQVSQCSGIHSVVINNGVDANCFSAGPESSPITILSVGNLIPIKGHELLLRAFAKARVSARGCRLEIIGDGPERQRLERLAARLDIGDRVSFLGRQNRTPVAEAMRRCAVFALPSSYEGLGCVYLEAMSSGKPAIGCRGQGIEEIIESGKNGWLVSPGSLSDLASALEALLASPGLRARLGTAARATILQSHTLDHQAAQLTQLYRECVA